MAADDLFMAAHFASIDFVLHKHDANVPDTSSYASSPPPERPRPLALQRAMAL
jgi:hypothetical protein